VSAREATSEFMLGLELVSQDVCAQAVAARSGPFAGIDVAAELVLGGGAAETTTTFASVGPGATYVNGYDPSNPDACAFPNGNTVNLCSAASVRWDYAAPADGQYRVVVFAEGQEAGPDLPNLRILVDGQSRLDVGVPAGALRAHEVTVQLSAGPHTVAAAFTNDFGDGNGGDRNLVVGSAEVHGPIGGVQGDSSNSPTRIATAQMMERMLLRPISQTTDNDEVAPVLTMMGRLRNAPGGGVTSAWSGACEAMFQHPDFLFTRSPTGESGGPGSPLWERALLVKSALDLMERPPTAAEFQRFDLGESRATLIDEWLRSNDFLASYQQRVFEILEYNGTEDGREPSLMWAYILKDDQPLAHILTADYGVTIDPVQGLVRAERPAHHGQTGVLTTAGYIRGKPGLPHYNYAARVFTGFMGTVFNVPQAALDARATSTPASTVDPTSVCYSCHQLLTPLAHQRLRWADDGTYREVDEDGAAIDDSDRGLADSYPYPGNGIEAFSLVAVRKEAYARRMANLHFLSSFGRALRAEEDERDVYQALYSVIDSGNGTLRDLIRSIHLSRSYTNPNLGTGG
jgi:hypothetical protein